MDAADADELFLTGLRDQLAARGCDAGIDEGCVTSGYESLHFHRGETQAAELDGTVLVSMEVNAILRHPVHGEELVSDLITDRASSLEGAYAACVASYASVTLPPLLGLFGHPIEPGPIENLTTMTDGVPTNWRVLSGELQIQGDRTGEVAAFLDETPAFALGLDTLCGYFHEHRLHWCKLFGKEGDGFERIFGMSLDGGIPEGGEGELAAKWAVADSAGPYQWRQFFVMYPDGEPEPEMVGKLEKHEAEQDRPRRRFLRRR